MNRLMMEYLTPERLQLILMPTEKCNFRCRYCYETHQQGKMSPETIEALKKLLLARAEGLKYLSLDWFGGEPLLEKEVVTDLLHYAHDLSQEYGFIFRSDMTTNGHFLHEEAFLHYGQFGLSTYQISFDGDADWHNEMRVFKRGQENFVPLWENMLVFNRLRKEGRLPQGEITLRLHLHNDNRKSLLSLIHKIKESLEPEFFKVFLKPIGHYGGENDGNFKVFHENSPEYKEFSKEISNLIPGFIVSLDDHDGPCLCYAAAANSFVVRSDGTLAKCTVAFGDHCNEIGKLSPDGRMLLQQERVLNWISVLQTGDEELMSCPLEFAREREKLVTGQTVP